MRKKALLLLAVIYLVFAVGVGMPDPLRGTAWPLMWKDLALPLYYAGILQMAGTGGRIISSLLNGKTIGRFGLWPVCLCSMGLIALALAGFAVSTGIALLLISSFLLGYGSGALDSGINNYTALHYDARCMSWLHASYGAGSTTGTLFMSVFLGINGNWRGGFFASSVIACGSFIILASSPSLWKVHESGKSVQSSESQRFSRPAGNLRVLSIPGVKASMACFFSLNSLLGIISTWGAVYLVMKKGLAGKDAALWISMVYISIMVCRVLTGFLSSRFSGRTIIFGGCVSLFLGCLLFIPASPVCSLVALVFLGFGIGPLHPMLIHENPARFGEANSQSAVGLQFAASSFSGFIIPALAGLLISGVSMNLFIILVLLFTLTFTLSVIILRSRRI